MQTKITDEDLDGLQKALEFKTQGASELVSAKKDKEF